MSEKIAKLLDSQTCVAHDPKHGEGIHRIVARNGHRSSAIRHNDVPALANHLKAGSLKSFHRLKMVDTW